MNTISLISAGKLAGITASALIALVFPLTLLIVWKRKTHARMTSAVCGAATFFLFAMVLEQLLHMVVLGSENFITRNLWAFALYGAFAAGIFEETGRFLAFKTVLRRRKAPAEGVMYGIGHGGIEAVLICSVNMVACLVAAVLWNGAGSAQAQLPLTVQTLAGSALANATGVLWMGGIERIIAVCFHIALSVLVFQAANRPGKLWLFPTAILLHAGLDVFAVLYQRGIITNIYLLEMLIGLVTLGVSLPAIRMYRQDAARFAADSTQAPQQEAMESN